MTSSASKAVLAVALLLAVGILATPSAAQKGKPQTCDDVSADLTLRDGSADSVISDGVGGYPAEINCANDTNHLYLNEAGRGFRFQLTDPSDGGTFTLETDGPVAANLGVRIADDGGMLAMEVGKSDTTEKVQFNFVVGDKRYFLSWGSAYDKASTATVTRAASGTWVIETSPAPNNIARLRECPAKGTCKTPVDRFYHAPLSMTATAVP